MRRTRRTEFWFAVLVLAAAAGVAFTGGRVLYNVAYDDGYNDGQEKTREEIQESLPLCEEDEALYPEHYEGPGDNEISDYRCMHWEP